MALIEAGIVLGGMAVGYWLYRNEYILSKKLDQAPKYTLLLDVDGTITRIPGQVPGSLFDVHIRNPSGVSVLPEKIPIFLFRHQTNNLSIEEAHQEYLVIRKFFQLLCELPEEHLQLIIITNNYRKPVKELWENFQCSWTRIDLANSSFRDDDYGTKKAYLKKLFPTGSVDGRRLMFFDDDPNNIPNRDEHEQHLSDLRVVYCRGGSISISKQLIDAGYTEKNLDLNGVHKFLETLWHHDDTISVNKVDK